jgi:putative sigma-54 modulation protein
MQLDIRMNGVADPVALREHVSNYITRHFGRLRPRIRHIVVRLTDINGPKGGNDIRCRMEAFGSRGSSVNVEDTKDNPFAAISSAAKRALRAFVKQNGRRANTLEWP